MHDKGLEGEESSVDGLDSGLDSGLGGSMTTLLWLRCCGEE